MIIAEPGIYDGLPEADYHADPVPGGSLSCSGAKRLLPPSCPALFQWERDHPVFKDVFDYGSAAHKLVLGTGPKIALADAPDWRSKAARDARDEARAQGFVPLLVRELDEIKAMAAAIEAHPIAGPLFDPLSGGKAEQSLFWQDSEFGVWCRLRLDWLAGMRARDGRLIVADYKTTDCAHPETFARKSVAPYGYHQQDAWYSDGVAAVLGEEPAFVFVAQEKHPPYLVSVVQLDETSRQAGRERNRRAVEIYRDCAEAGFWPGYSQDIELISLPPWARQRAEADW